MSFKINKKILKKTLTITSMTCITLSTIGFTMLGIGAGGKPTNIALVSASDQANAEKWNPKLKLFINSGFLSNHGRWSQAQEDAYNEIQAENTVPAVVEAKNKINKEAFQKEIKDNSSMFQAGVVIFSLSAFVLIACIIYYFMFKKKFKDSSEQ